MNSNTSPLRRASFLGRAISPWQFVAFSAFSFLSLSCGVLMVLCDWSRDSIWHSIVGLTAAISLLLAPAVCIGAFFELLRRGWDWRLLMSGLLAASGIAIFIGAVHFRFRELGL